MSRPRLFPTKPGNLTILLYIFIFYFLIHFFFLSKDDKDYVRLNVTTFPLI